MTSSGILDTSTLILLGRVTALDALPEEAFITAVTLAELSVGPLVAKTDHVLLRYSDGVHPSRVQRIRVGYLLDDDVSELDIAAVLEVPAGRDHSSEYRALGSARH